MPVGLHDWRPQATQRYNHVDMRVAALEPLLFGTIVSCNCITLAPLSRRVVSFNLACSALSSNGPRFNLSVQTLEPLDGGADPAGEVKLPLKQPN